MRTYIWISILETRKGQLYIAGRLPNYLGVGKEEFYAVDENNNRVQIIPTRAPALDVAPTETKKAQTGFFFETSLPLHRGADYRFICVRGNKPAELIPRYGKFSRLLSFNESCFEDGGFIVRNLDNHISVASSGIFRNTSLFRKMRSILRNEAPPEALQLREEAAKLRKASRPIWLISDRSDSAGDNGEAFFEYLMSDRDNTKARKKFDIRFIISASSPDFERMKAIGPVVKAGSDEHRLLFLASSLVISSSGDEWMRNPLGGDLKYYRDIISNRYVFLQHGVIKDDLSAWLHKNKKNLNLFITSAYDEWMSICKGNYGYDESVVKLTGLARYDKLHNMPARTIAILPTWRLYAASPIIPGTSERPYSDSFKDTDYCKFYNRLINDERLINCLNDKGYTGTFYLHPSHMNQRPDYKGNETIKVWDGLVPFSKVFNESALLITDYSSVAIDFAYLGKPVIYTQFDKDKFFSSHSYVPGYYDYERDGFGPVCYDYESSVEAIIEAVDRDCAEEDKYLQRLDKFFAFRDTNNCRRIYEELLKLI